MPPPRGYDGVGFWGSSSAIVPKRSFRRTGDFRNLGRVVGFENDIYCMMTDTCCVSLF